jgi:hypothetical protein
VTLQKVGPNGEKLAKAAFALYQKTESGWELYTADHEDGIYTTDKSGQILVTGLAENEYYFVETAAPQGYVITKDSDGSSKKYSFKIGLNEEEAVVNAEIKVVNEKATTTSENNDSSKSGNKSGTGSGTGSGSVKTGDDTPIGRYAALFGAAVLLLVLAGEARRRRRNSKR